MDQILIKKEADFALGIRSDISEQNDKLECIDCKKEEIILAVPKSTILMKSIPVDKESTLQSIDLKVFRNENFVLRDRNSLIR